MKKFIVKEILEDAKSQRIHSYFNFLQNNFKFFLIEIIGWLIIAFERLIKYKHESKKYRDSFGEDMEQFKSHAMVNLMLLIYDIKPVIPVINYNKDDILRVCSILTGMCLIIYYEINDRIKHLSHF